VTIGNVVTGDADVPPTECTAAEPCETEHHTPATWTLAKTSDPASGSVVQPGSTVAYTVTAVNGSAAAVDGVVVTDDLSDVLSHATFGSFTNDDGGTATRTDETLTWNVGTLAAGQTRSITYTVTVDEDAHGVTIGNVVTGDGSVPPTDCTPIEPCETEHSTPATWTLAKTSDPESGSEVEPGATVNYTVTATNSSGAPVDDVVVTDDLSNVLNHATFGSFTNDDGGTATRSGNTITWNVGTLAAGQTRSITYAVTVDGDAHGVTIGNVVTGDGDEPPTECTAEEPCETEHHTPATWTLAKTSDPASGSVVAPGSTVTYTVTATNTSGAAVDDVVVNDDLSDVLAHATFGSFTDDDGGNASRSGDALTWNVGTLAAGEARTITYTVTIDDDAHGVTIGNVVTGDGDVPPTECTAEEPCETEHHTPATWSLSKTSDPATGSEVEPGSTVTYTLTAVNGSGADVDDVVVSDDLSNVLSHATFGSFTDDDGGKAARSGTTITWDVGTLAAGQTRTVTYTVTVNDDAHGVTIGNVVTGDGEVPPTDCTPLEPCETEHHTPATWTLAKTSDPASGSVVAPGATVTYTVTATNDSGADVHDAVVNDDLSDVLSHATFGSFTNDDGGAATRSGNALTWNVGTLAAGQTRSITYTVTVDDDAHGVRIGNVVTGDGDVPPTECSAEEPCETEHETPATWSLSKTSDPATGSEVEPGSTVTYTLTAVNGSGAAVNDVVVNDDLSDVLAHADFGSFTDSDGGTASRSGDEITWALGTLAAGETRTVTYTVTIHDDAHGVTIGNVVTGDGDVPPTECSAEEPCETEHHTPATWTLAKTSDPATGSEVEPGSTIAYTVTATNTSEADVADVVVTDDLSDVLDDATFGAITESDGGNATRAGSTITWNVGTLAAGATRSITYTVTVNDDAHGVTIGNVVTGDGDEPPTECSAEEPCETEHHTPATWTLAKSSDPASGSEVEPGSTVTYTLTATNTSEADVADVVLTDDLSNVLDHAAFGSFTDDDGGRAARSGDTITWELGTLAAGEVRTVTYTVVIDDDAHGVTIGNVVTGDGEVPPTDCTADEPCETEHETPATWTLAKTSDPASGSIVAPGTTVTYTVTATNTSDAAVPDVVVTDDLSDVLTHATFGSFTDGDGGRATRSGNTITWALGTLGARETRSITYEVTVGPDAHGVRIGNVVTGDGEVPPTECTADEPCETEHETPATWSLSKTSDPATGSEVEPGSTVTYTLTAVNASGADVHDAVIGDDLSNVLDHATFGSFTDDDEGRATRAGDAITWSLGTLAAGTTRTVTYTVTIHDDAHGVTIGNVVTGDGDVPPERCTPLEPCETEHHTPATWTLAKTSDPASGSVVAPGTTVTYTVTATNTSDADVADVVVTDDLSDVLDDATFGAITDGDGGRASRTGNTITWTLGTLAARETRSITYTVTVDDDAHGARIGNVVTGDGEVPPTDCTVEDPCTTEHETPATWTLAKTSDPASGSVVAPGATVTYTVTATNTSDADVADVVVTDDLSDVLDDATFGAFDGDDEGRATRSGNTIDWAVGTLAARETRSIAYTVTVNPDAHGAHIGNVVTGDGEEPPTDCTPVEPCETEHETPATWSLSKTSDPATGSEVQPGSTVTYTLTAVNGSGAEVTDVVVVDDLSDVLDDATFTAFADDDGGTATRDGDTITWAIGTLAAGETRTITYSVTLGADAYEARIRNAVTGNGSEPPERCPTGEPCTTEHLTPKRVERPPATPTPPAAATPRRLGPLPRTGVYVVRLLVASGLLLAVGAVLSAGGARGRWARAAR